MVTLTPSRLVGSLPPTMSSAVQARVVLDRRKPYMLIHAPGVTPAWNPAALTTPLRVDTTGPLPAGADSGVNPITMSNDTRFSPIADPVMLSIGRMIDAFCAA